MIEKIADKIRDMGFDPKDAKNLEYGNTAKLKNSFLLGILNAEKNSIYISEKNWHLFETDEENPFFISDHPVVLNNEYNFGPYGNLGLGVKGVQVFLPISTTLLLAMFCPSYLRDLYKTKENAIWLLENSILNDKLINNINSIYKHFEDFTKTELINLSYENVKFYNSLQISFSEQYIFSKKNDFSLVKEMLKNDKELKNGFRLT